MVYSVMLNQTVSKQGTLLMTPQEAVFEIDLSIARIKGLLNARRDALLASKVIPQVIVYGGVTVDRYEAEVYREFIKIDLINCEFRPEDDPANLVEDRFMQADVETVTFHNDEARNLGFKPMELLSEEEYFNLAD